MTDYPQTKIIGLSFLNDRDLINNIFNAGASDFIGKDQTLQSLCQAIRDLIS
jgi:DNA-binding NarL/FixJ family response regulator